MFREKRLPFKRTWWNSLELLVVSLFLVQFQGTSSLVAKTLSADDPTYGSAPPETDQPSQRHWTQPIEPIRLADEPVLIDRPPTSPAPIVVPTQIESGDLSDSGAMEAGSIASEPTASATPEVPLDRPAEVSDTSATYVADEPQRIERFSPAPVKAAPRSQQDLLADYQNKIHVLVVDKGLKTSLEGSDIRSQAKAATIATLEQLDSDRKAVLLKFLAESNLIDSNSPIISLVSADLSGADLNHVNLSKLDLRDADLRDANLSNADLNSTKLFRAALNRADLSFSNLSRAELFRASLRNAKLFSANLSNANLNGVDLKGSDISLANLSGADLSNSDLSQTDLSFANLSSAKLIGSSLNSVDLSFANLNGANLKGVDLSGANLRNADLTGADLSDANLSGADLTGAKLNGANLFGVDLNSTKLSNTTMPDGTIRK